MTDDNELCQSEEKAVFCVATWASMVTAVWRETGSTMSMAMTWRRCSGHNGRRLDRDILFR